MQGWVQLHIPVKMEAQVCPVTISYIVRLYAITVKFVAPFYFRPLTYRDEDENSKIFVVMKNLSYGKFHMVQVPRHRILQ